MTKVLDREVYYAGERIFREEQFANCAYLIETGEVRLTKGELQGESVEIATIGPKTIFGEMAVIDNSPRMATATATKETVVVAVDRRQLDEKLNAIDEDTRALFQYLLNYIRGNMPFEERAATFDDAVETVQDRVAKEMIDSPHVADALAKIDPFLRALFDILVLYTERRLPPK